MNNREISEDEYQRLLKENRKARKNQIALICEVYPKEERKVLIRR